jgi:signal transduction histidine kinase
VGLRLRLPAVAQRGVAVALYLAVAVATASIARGDPAFALADDSTRALAAELAAGGVLLACALAMRGAFGALLAAAAIAWPLSEWNTPAAGPAFTAGLVLFAVWPPLLAGAALRGPDERALGRSQRVVVALAFVAGLGVLGLIATTAFDPRAEGCFDCPDNRLLIAGDPGVWHRATQVGLALTVVWTAGLAAIMAVALGRASRPRRRLTGPVLLCLLGAVALFAADAVHAMGRGFLSNDSTERALRLAEGGALVAVAAALVWRSIAAWHTRRTLARMVVDLGVAPHSGRLRERLADRLGDPALDIRYATGNGGFVDSDGEGVDGPAPAGRQLTQINAGGRVVAAIVHRPGLLDDPALIDALARTAALGLEHERLRATRAAQLRELRASRGRIVAAADAERRRLERDLHDGSQQRLVTLSVGVRLTRRRHAQGDAALDGELAVAEQELRETVAELRELAHGLFPAALDDEGLAAAVEALAEREPRLDVVTLPQGRFPPAAESVAYRLVEEALRLALSGEVEVTVSSSPGRLIVDLHAPGGFGDLPESVDDRVGAIDGSVSSAATTIHVELPCGS